MEKERDVRREQDSQRLESLRAELEWKLHHLEPREKTVEAMVAKVNIWPLLQKLYRCTPIF